MYREWRRGEGRFAQLDFDTYHTKHSAIFDPLLPRIRQGESVDRLAAELSKGMSTAVWTTRLTDWLRTLPPNVPLPQQDLSKQEANKRRLAMAKLFKQGYDVPNLKLANVGEELAQTVSQGAG